MALQLWKSIRTVIMNILKRVIRFLGCTVNVPDGTQKRAVTLLCIEFTWLVGGGGLLVPRRHVN